MSTLATPSTKRSATKSSDNDNGDHEFLRFLPAVRTHAAICFRHLPAHDLEEAIAEAIAAAYCNFRSACRKGRESAIRPSTLAHYSVLNVKSGRRVGGHWEGKKDVMSRITQRRNGLRVYSLPLRDSHELNCLTVPDQRVWRDRLLHDRRTPIPDQVSFRCDWSTFMARQSDRTRQIMAFLAEGYRRHEVADKLGVTPPAITQRMNRAKREWDAFRADATENTRDKKNRDQNTGPAACQLVSA